MIVSVPMHDLRSVLPFKANEDIRYYLNGIAIEPVASGGALLIATNGHVMAILHSPTAAADKPRVLAIPTKLPELIDAVGGKRDSDELHVENEQSHLTLYDGDGDRLILAGPAFIDGRFPDWRMVCPKPDDLVEGLVNVIDAKYLAMVRRCYPSDNYNGLMFWHRKGDSSNSLATIVRGSARPELVILVMPLRRDQSYDWPEWMK